MPSDVAESTRLVLWVEKWLRGVQTVPELEAAIARDAARPRGM
jgi:hypothetical protein